MRNASLKLMVVCGLLGAFACGLAAQSTLSADERWTALVDEYLDKVYFPRNPSAATVAGIHQYDKEIEDYSKKEAAREAVLLHGFEKRIAQFPSRGLSRVNAADREILLGVIRSNLLTLETFRPLEKDPNTYSGGVTNSVYVLMNRKFAATDERLRSVVAREEEIPSILKTARDNLSNPPHIYSEICLEQMPGIIGFFEKDVPSAFADAKDEGLKRDFGKTNAGVVRALTEYQNWLKTELLARSNGDFRIGAGNFSKKLLYEDMVDTPPDRLLEVGMQDLRKNQAEFQRVAREIDAQKQPQEVLAELAAMHPEPGRLLETFAATFDGLIAFIEQNKIITVPAGAKPIVQETPPFERATTTASMDTPGPFEKVAKESYFNVTLPAPGDSAADVASLMAGFNIGTIFSTSTHETYPGHYMQYLWAQRAPSKLRKVFNSNTNVEGWAHYCEQMMLEEGYARPGAGAKDEREANFIHLGQLQDALLRNARLVVGIQLHTGKMSLQQAREFFVKEGYQSTKVADIETKRGTADPTYLYYTLGKLQILKLREDYRKKMGAEFTLQKFHDTFMGQGFPPISVVRKTMMGDDSPAL